MEIRTYEEYFGLNTTPFGRDIPVTELMKSQQWNELAGRLVYVAKKNLFGIFTGETGTGKTTAVRRMAAELDKNRFRLLYVYDSDLTPRNFYVETLHQLGYKARFYRGDAKRQLMKALSEIADANQIAAIILDEAHLLSSEMLEEIRFLLNMDMDSKSSCSLILNRTIRVALKTEITNSSGDRRQSRHAFPP
jgi:type II secretory pathway predicted ATPase ExeA